MKSETIQGIAIIGLGCVGTGFYSLIKNKPGWDIRGIAVKDRSKKRSVEKSLIRYEYQSLIEDENVQTVVEMIDDSEAALDIARRTLQAGKNLVSANKKMIAAALPELVELAYSNKAIFRCEAAVCGSIPIIRTLDEYLRGLEIQSVSGIFNGSSNFILSQMWRNKQRFQEALIKAQEEGFAETDPSLDVDGYDAENKLSIAHAFAFNTYLPTDSILTFGIKHVGFEDLKYGAKNQYKLKPIAYSDTSGIAYVLPAFVKQNHPAYPVEDEYNLATIDSKELAHQSFIGKGAGSLPTGKAVLEDVLAVRNGSSYALELKDDYQTESDTVEIYISKQGSFALNIPFDELHESFDSADRSYRAGAIPLQVLKEYREALISSAYFVALKQI